MLQPSVLPFSILPNHNNIHILMACHQPRQIKTIHKRRVQIKLLPQLHIQRTHTSTHRRIQSTFQTHLILPDRIQNLRRNRLHVAVNIELFEVDRRVHRLHDLFHGSGDERADAVAWN
ncbi:hypothetical protein HanRHA438_Chr12g0559641 [Helianthus annuus]|nr:hypothetical protein HanRHA438_Chr12g0559641 [Helianthus annuus]